MRVTFIHCGIHHSMRLARAHDPDADVVRRWRLGRSSLGTYLTSASCAALPLSRVAEVTTMPSRTARSLGRRLSAGSPTAASPDTSWSGPPPRSPGSTRRRRDPAGQDRRPPAARGCLGGCLPTPSAGASGTPARRCGSRLPPAAYQSEWMTGDPCNTATLTLPAHSMSALKSCQFSAPCFQWSSSPAGVA